MASSVNDLEEIAIWCRRKVLEMAVKANSGHVSTAMSQMEILVSLYFGGILRYDARDPKWEERDYFLLSKGHGAIGLYPVLAKAGYFAEGDLDSFCSEGSKLGVHADPSCPGIEHIAGSLGHGLPVATGIAQALKNEGKDNLVYVLVGDGELQEGSNWEALLTASQQNLGNLVIIVDSNDQATLGHLDDYQTAKDGPRLYNLAAKFRAFNCLVDEVYGHDLSALLKCFKELEGARRFAKTHWPWVVIAKTKKGKNLSCMEGKRLWHGRVPKDKDLEQCHSDLHIEKTSRTSVIDTGQSKHAKGMRDHFFDALYPHFKENKNLVLISADNGFPTIEKWAETLYGQFYQVGVAEQQMVGMAAGMALRGKKVFCYAICPFVTARVYEFLKLDICARNLPVTMVGIGAGYAYDDAGPTHHTVEDIAIMRALPNIEIYSPADGVTASAIADYLATSKKPSYVRLDRGGMENIYDPYTMVAAQGFSKIGNDVNGLAIISTGIMTHQALKIAQQVNSSVIDVWKLKPIHEGFLQNSIWSCSNVVTLEEHRAQGGLGSIISEIFTDNHIKTPLLRIAAEDRFAFELGGRDIVWKNMRLDVPSVVKRIKEWADA